MKSKRAQHVQEYMAQLEAEGRPVEFTSHEYAEECDIGRAEATLNIQGYLDAQRSTEPDGEYVLRRKEGTRTTSAVWVAGHRVKDARGMGRGTSSDVKARVMRALIPDLGAIAEKNPRAARQVEAQVSATVDGLFAMLDMALIGVAPDDE